MQEPIPVLGISRIDSFLKTLLALLLFTICVIGDIFFDIFIIKNFIFFYIYFTFLSSIFLLLFIRNDTFRLPYAVIPLVIFVGICFLSLLWSVRLKDAEITIVLILTGFLTFCIFSNVEQQEEDIYLFLKFIVIATSLNALTGIFQGIFGHKFLTIYGFAAHGTTYNPNAFSGFLGIVFPFAILIFIRTEKTFWLLPIFLILLANLFSISRVGIFTIFLISAVVLFFLFYKGYRSSGVRVSFTILLSVLVYLFLVFVRERLFVDLSSEITLYRDPILTASINRVRIWQGTLPIIFHHPFGGVGLRSFEDIFKHLNNPFLVWPRVHAHNLFLHITSEIGIIGLLFFISFSFWVFSTGLTNYRNLQSLSPNITSLFLFLATSSFFLNNLVEYNWVHPLFQVLFYFLTSSIFAIKRFLNPERKEISFRPTRPLKFFLSGLLILFWVFYVGSPGIGNYYLTKARKLLLKNDQKGIQYLVKASFFDSSNPEPYVVLSQIYKSAWLNTKKELFFENATHLQKMAITSSPMNADFYLDLAKLYDEARRSEEAHFYYEEAIRINPNTPKYKHEFASFLARNNETEGAIALWKDLRVFLEKYEPTGIDLMAVYMNLCPAYKKIGNLELLKNCLDLVMSFPDDIIRKEPGNSALRENFISYKKKAADELTNLIKTKNP